MTPWLHVGYFKMEIQIISPSFRQCIVLRISFNAVNFLFKPYLMILTEANSRKSDFLYKTRSVPVSLSNIMIWLVPFPTQRILTKCGDTSSWNMWALLRTFRAGSLSIARRQQVGSRSRSVVSVDWLESEYAASLFGVTTYPKSWEWFENWQETATASISEATSNPASIYD